MLVVHGEISLHTGGVQRGYSVIPIGRLEARLFRYFYTSVQRMQLAVALLQAFL